MAKIAQSLRLSTDEIDNLMRSVAHMRIATIGPDTRINLTPMTFGWAGGHVYTYARGQKAANLRRTPTATVLVDIGTTWRELQGIMLQGTAKVLETAKDEASDPHLAQARLNLGQKHGLSENGQTASYAATASGNSRRWIAFLPEKIVSWDNAKLAKK